jgi:hypothetical protein
MATSVCLTVDEMKWLNEALIFDKQRGERSLSGVDFDGCLHSPKRLSYTDTGLMMALLEVSFNGNLAFTGTVIGEATIHIY